MIRAAFIPEDGCLFVGADYSQVELRIMAHLANEEGLINAFKAGMDIHTRTAMDVFNVEEKDVTPLLRRQAKAINFGIDYGMSDFGLAERLEIPVYQAREFIESYFHKYPNVRKFMDNTIAECQEKGYVTTMLNRRRDIPEINSSNRSLKEFGKRAAMNAPVQGSAADLIKIAMINVYNRLNKEGLKAKMILQIHDCCIQSSGQHQTRLCAAHLAAENDNRFIGFWRFICRTDHHATDHNGKDTAKAQNSCHDADNNASRIVLPDIPDPGGYQRIEDKEACACQ